MHSEIAKNSTAADETNPDPTEPLNTTRRASHHRRPTPLFVRRAAEPPQTHPCSPPSSRLAAPRSTPHHHAAALFAGDQHQPPPAALAPTTSFPISVSISPPQKKCEKFKELLKQSDYTYKASRKGYAGVEAEYAFSRLDEGIAKEAKLLKSTALDAALNAQFLVQIGVFNAVPMIMGFVLELGLLKELEHITLDVPSSMVVLSIGLQGEALLSSISNLQRTSGFIQEVILLRLEVALLLIAYIAYGYARGGAVSFVLLTFSSWFLVISWLFAPYIFNPSGFEWQKTVEDFDDWTSWLLYKGGVGVKGDNSWESVGGGTGAL